MALCVSRTEDDMMSRLWTCSPTLCSVTVIWGCMVVVIGLVVTVASSIVAVGTDVLAGWRCFMSGPVAVRVVWHGEEVAVANACYAGIGFLRADQRVAPVAGMFLAGDDAAGVGEVTQMTASPVLPVGGFLMASSATRAARRSATADRSMPAVTRRAAASTAFRASYSSAKTPMV